MLAAALGLLSVAALAALFRNAPVSPRLAPPKPKEPDFIVSSGTVKDGDVLALMLKRSGVDGSVEPAVERAFAKTYNLRSIQPGHTFELEFSTTGVLRKFTYHKSPTETYVVSRSSGNVFASEKVVSPTVWRERRITGEVTDNLYHDLLKMGYDENFVAGFVADLADNIFGWRIDFFTEQRPGDTFDVLLEQEYLEGSDTPLRGRNRILAAIYNGKATKDKENIAIRYQAKGEPAPDYYDDDGKAVRRAFLRAPFTHAAFRVSSNFSLHRFHPILRVYRPHHGTDYAAALGTPVAAIGQGTVVRAGWAHGYGNCIDVRHNATYTSRYGHLSRVAVHTGQFVHQGQYIGNVGNTGLSTGPHLHFEMIINGVSRNFLTMTFPSASSLSPTAMPDFIRARDALLARLKNAPADKPKPEAPAPQVAMDPRR